MSALTSWTKYRSSQKNDAVTMPIPIRWFGVLSKTIKSGLVGQESCRGTWPASWSALVTAAAAHQDDLRKTTGLMTGLMTGLWLASWTALDLSCQNGQNVKIWMEHDENKALKFSWWAPVKITERKVAPSSEHLADRHKTCQGKAGKSTSYPSTDTGRENLNEHETILF